MIDESISGGFQLLCVLGYLNFIEQFDIVVCQVLANVMIVNFFFIKIKMFQSVRSYFETIIDHQNQKSTDQMVQDAQKINNHQRSQNFLLKLIQRKALSSMTIFKY